MPNDDNTPPRAALERALMARVADRITAAGRRVDPVAVERIVRQVLERLQPEAPAAPAQPEPAVLVFVVGTEHGERDLSELRSVLSQAAAHRGARLLAAHREPTAVSAPYGRAEPARGRPLVNSLETP